MNETIKTILGYFKAKECCVQESKKTPKEHGKQFTLKTRKTYSGRIWRFKVDNCLTNSQLVKKCDYTFFLEESNYHFFVELKGEDTKTAVKQLLSTISDYHHALNKRKKELKFTACAVISSYPKEDSHVRKARTSIFKEYGSDFKVKEYDMELPVS